MQTRVKCPNRRVAAADEEVAIALLVVTVLRVVRVSGGRAVEEAGEAWVAEWAARSPE